MWYFLAMLHAALWCYGIAAPEGTRERHPTATLPGPPHPDWELLLHTMREYYNKHLPEDPAVSSTGETSPVHRQAQSPVKIPDGIDPVDFLVDIVHERVFRHVVLLCASGVRVHTVIPVPVLTLCATALARPSAEFGVFRLGF
jgi:hypothetical protein